MKYRLPQIRKQEHLVYADPLLNETKIQTQLLQKIYTLLSKEKVENKASEHVNTTEAAAMLKCSAHTIRRWLKNNRLTGIKRGSSTKHRYLIPRAAIEKMLNDSDVKQF